IELHLKILEGINDLNFISTDIEIESKTTGESEEKNVKIEYSTPIATKEEESDEEGIEKNVDVLKRQLKGGFLDRLGVFIPETIIRSRGFEEGDYIKATHLRETIYDYKLIKKGETSGDTNRIQIDFCVVKRDGSLYYVDDYLVNGSKKIIKNGEMPHTFTINEHAIQKYNLNEGDLIDIAYFSPRINDYKVIWKHNTYETPHITPMTSSHYKIKDKEDKNSEKTDELKGKTVMLLSDVSNSEFAKAIANRGGSFIQATGDEQTIRLDSMVYNCDILVIMVSRVGHVSTELVRESAKKYNKKFLFMKSQGLNEFIDKVKEGIGSDLQVLNN
ncbi:DUF2325 domain-containing protein, partial [Bacillus pumilus]|uniref:DUF2325 domain-containing protein n=1 Tax=Bacillus pumilus TaxID=1408 RepID=UPI00119D7556